MYASPQFEEEPSNEKDCGYEAYKLKSSKKLLNDRAPLLLSAG